MSETKLMLGVIATFAACAALGISIRLIAGPSLASFLMACISGAAMGCIGYSTSKWLAQE